MIQSISHPVWSQYLDITGLTEVSTTVKQELVNNGLIAEGSRFGVGYIAKTKALQYFDWTNTNWTNGIGPKAIIILGLFGILFLVSLFFRRYKGGSSFSVMPKKRVESSSTRMKVSEWKGIKAITPSKKVMNLFVGEAMLLKKYFKPLAVLIIGGLWLGTFFSTYNITSHFLIPAIMLLILPLYTDFFDNVSKNNLTNIFSTSVYSESEKMMVKIGIALLINIFLLVPIFMHQDFMQLKTTIIIMTLLCLGAYLSSRYLKSVKLFEIIYIVIFISYTNGSPILPIY